MDNGYDLRLKSISDCQRTIDDCIEKLKSIQRSIDLELEALKMRDIIWDLNEVKDELSGTKKFLEFERPL